MTSGRAIRNCEDGMNCILTYPDECTVPGESRKDFSKDFTRRLGEEHESIGASQSLATWESPACREPHSFPRENLGNIGHIEKLEFRIEDVSDHRVRVLQHHQNLTSHDVKLEG